MSALGYKKANETNWTLRMPQIMIISKPIAYANVPCFDITLGIVFNPLSKPASWKKFRLGHARFNITGYNLLQDLGEPTEQLDRVFAYDINNITATTESELKNNIPVVMDLFKNKVIPYFQNWNSYDWLIEHFTKELYGKQFEVYEDPRNYIGFFKRQANMVAPG
jgi:hypothetical protein